MTRKFQSRLVATVTHNYSRTTTTNGSTFNTGADPFNPINRGHNGSLGRSTRHWRRFRKFSQPSRSPNRRYRNRRCYRRHRWLYIPSAQELPEASPTKVCFTLSAFLSGAVLMSVVWARMVIRIMIMVPLYAISSLIALFSLEAAFFIDAIRDIYEVGLLAPLLLEPLFAQHAPRRLSSFTVSSTFWSLTSAERDPFSSYYTADHRATISSPSASLNANSTVRTHSLSSCCGEASFVSPQLL